MKKPLQACRKHRNTFFPMLFISVCEDCKKRYEKFEKENGIKG